MTVEWNEPELRELLTGRTGAVVTHISEVTEQVLVAAQAICPRRSGATAASLHAEVEVVGDLVIGRVGSDSPVVGWLEEGTGLYGPRHQWITPIRARVLGPLPSPYPRFIARSRGMRAQPFLKRALEIGSPYPVRDG
ncbi:HK97 gp10 family phage protein [Streptacidiphilus cavernicola]|uniref:HK97 gp10 family phage protein n=1 Tax=Streptacidiphilus cavernicola TaxID=3342716 RepID=A0ABV6VY98_9ACTN